MTSTDRKAKYCNEVKLGEYFYTQDFSIMMIIDKKSLSIKSISENSNRLYNINPKEAIGKKFTEYFSDQALEFIQEVKQRKNTNPVSILTNLIANDKKSNVVLSAFSNKAYLVLEIESNKFFEKDHDEVFSLIDCSEKFNASKNYNEIYVNILETAFSLTNYDSIMLYKYEEGGYGKVLLHRRENPDIKDYTDHYFPATDTPTPIKNLFKQRLIRYIPDINYKPNKLIGSIGTADVDISCSNGRGVVPVHIDFLRNMGAQAAISIPMVISGNLWGIIACQNVNPLFISIKKRKLLTLIALLSELSLSNFKVEEENLIQQKVLELFQEMHELLIDNNQDIAHFPKILLSKLIKFIRYDGITYCIQDSCITKGKALGLSIGKKVYEYYHKQSKDIFYLSFEDISVILEDLNNVHNIKSLVLIIINRQQKIFAILYRVGELQKVKWAGNPNFSDDNVKQGVTPRNSFQTWVEEHKNVVIPWSENEKMTIEHIQRLLTGQSYQRELTRQAFRDNLTDTYNRHYLEDAYDREFAITKRKNSAFSLCIIDIDFFKKINDTYGHSIGDKTLKMLAKSMLKMFRSEDIICRYGGEEFIILMANAPLKVAYKRCEDFRKYIAKKNIVVDNDHKINITISIGVSCIYPKKQHLSLEQFIQSADSNLYQAKNNGRNNVVYSKYNI